MIREISAKTILRKQRQIDSWFISSYGLNLYRGCSHNCFYCDGRDEKYQVDGKFDSEVSVKINALEILGRELDPARKRKPFSNGFFLVGGGVSDSYQYFEKQYGLTRGTLELMYRFAHPVHMLTKSTLIERDIDLLGKINRQNRAIISFSFSTVDDNTGRVLEPGVPLPSRRLDTLRRFADAGFACGVFLMPVVPFFTDSAEMIEASVGRVKDAGASFIVFGGMTLKPGRQKDYFMDFLRENRPELLPGYDRIYGDNSPWGSPAAGYEREISRRFAAAADRHNVPKRIPAPLFAPMVSKSELILLILEQLDYLADIEGRNNPYGTAARSLWRLEQPIESFGGEQLLGLPGIGQFTAGLIREIADTGRCGYYEKLL